MNACGGYVLVLVVVDIVTMRVWMAEVATATLEGVNAEIDTCECVRVVRDLA